MKSELSIHKRAAIIPAFNEEKSIETVVLQVSQRALVIVIDDASSDKTALLAAQAGAIVVKHTHNRGYNYALQTGLQTAIEMGFTFAITMDADGQHDPSLLDQFYMELESGADMVVGNRDRLQRWSEGLFATVSRIRWGLKDPLCGMKGYRLDKIQSLKDISTYDSIGTELALRLVKNGVNIIQFPIKTRPREGSSRFGKGWSANIKICVALYKNIRKI